MSYLREFASWDLYDIKQGKLKRGMSDDDVTVIPFKKNWWPFCSEELHRQIIHQNARFFKRNWLIPSPPAISIKNLKKTMKMTWHFVISAVWAGTAFGPRLWQLSVRQRSLTDIKLLSYYPYMTWLICRFSMYYVPCVLLFFQFSWKYDCQNIKKYNKWFKIYARSKLQVSHTVLSCAKFMSI